MQTTESHPPQSGAGKIVVFIGRVALAIAIPAIAFYVLYQGFLFLRDGDSPKWAMTLIAILWGVGGVAALYWIFNWLVEMLPLAWTRRLQPFVFVGPALAILAWYLAFPAARTLWISLFDRGGPPDQFLTIFTSWPPENWVGLQNYTNIFSERLMRETFRNNLMWIVFGSSFSVGFGLLIAILADRSRWEKVAKSLIFLPMAISFVGAGVIWNFMYEVRPSTVPQIGLVNAIVVAFGGDAHPWPAYTSISPWNNLFLIVIVVWLQVGFSMVLFSAALKGVPEDLREAGRVDGASEMRILSGITIPYIRGTIITVWTTIVIFTLKIFDVVWVMTGGQFGTEVIATQFYRQSFVARNPGYGSAIAIVLLIAVIPVGIYNLRQFQDREAL